MRSNLFKILCFISAVLAADIPLSINYQGKLLNGSAPLSGSYDLQIVLFSESAGGTALWTKTFSPVSVNDGLFSLTLGDDDGGTSIASVLKSNAELWIEVRVKGPSESSFTTLSPREKLLAAPWAITIANQSVNEDKVDWGTGAGQISADDIPFDGNTDGRWGASTPTNVDAGLENLASRVQTLEGGGTGNYVELGPASSQTDASTNISIDINKTGASGDLLSLSVSGDRKFQITRNGDVFVNRNLGVGTDTPAGILQAINITNTDVCSGGTSDAESEWGSSYVSDYAFDDDTTTLWGNDSHIPTWLEYDFGAGNAKIINRYRIFESNGDPVWTSLNFCPRDWQFQGSNDGSSWITLDSRSGESWSSAGWKEYSFSNTTPYRYYRIYITQGNDGNDVMIWEMEMYEAASANFVVKSNGNVGIGTSAPAEKLDVMGGIKISNTDNTNAGTIRWTGSDFEGYDGTNWVSLTGGGSSSGNYVQLGPASTQDDTSDNISVDINKTGSSGNLFRLSVSGSSRMLVDRDGNLTISGYLDLSNNQIRNLSTPTTSGTVSGYGVSTGFLLGKLKASTASFKLYPR